MIPPKTLADLQWPSVREELARRCHTARAEARARELGLCDEIDEARERIARVSELRTLRQLEQPPPFGGIETVDTAVTRAAKGGALDGDELRAIARTLAGASRLRRHLAAHRDQAPRLAADADATPDLGRQIAEPVLEAFDDDGRLADHASDKLGGLRARAVRLQDELLQKARAFMNDPRLADELQDRFYTRRDGRVVVPIRTDAPSRVKGIVHGKSQSGNTLFVEPAAFVELNNGLAIAEAEIEAEERRILAEMSGWIRDDADAIRAAIEAATAVDVLDAAARLADAMDASEPALAERGAFELKRGRHPLMALSDKPCVPNDLSLPDGGILVVSGPNAGGKTVALKTLGCAAILARAGLHVPADPGSSVPWCETLLTDIGDEQSLERDLSTFSAHVMHLIEMIDAASPTALILIDEIAVGTAPEQGAALAQAVLETLAARGCRAVVTTHYEPVKALAARDERFLSAAVGFDMDRLEPTFRLHLGAPGASGALIVARRLGMHAEVVDRAEALLGDGLASVDALLAEAERERHRLAEEAAALAATRAELAQSLRAAEAARHVAEERARKAREGAHDDAVAALRRARAELDDVGKQLRKRRKVEIGDVRKTVDRVAAEVAASAPARPAPTGAPPPPSALTPGTRVTVGSLGGRGEVVAAPEGKRVTVQLGALRTTVPITDVRLVAGGRPAAAPPPPAAPPSSRRGRTIELEDRDDDEAPARTRDNTLDLRGERVDDAIDRLERFVDESLLAERDIVFVIHGHGTGALRKAVREQLKASPVVQKWRPGELSEGGDGITVIWLDVA